MTEQMTVQQLIDQINVEFEQGKKDFVDWVLRDRPLQDAVYQCKLEPNYLDRIDWSTMPEAICLDGQVQATPAAPWYSPRFGA